VGEEGVGVAASVIPTGLKKRKRKKVKIIA
jgi:hypothetical protein